MDDDYNINYKKQNDEDKKRRRIIIYIIIIIIILLSLITSCSCTSKFFGKIGDLFRNEGQYTIDKDSDNHEVIKNQELKFDTDYVEMSLSDTNTKIGFSYTNINPKGFTCSTSDAEIATCYVINNYVVVIPKKIGEVTIYLQTTTNGKVYEATTQVSILDITRAIELESVSGTINLNKTKEKEVVYRLIGLVGEVSLTISDESVATAVAQDGILKITGLKVGTATITLSITYNDRVYTNTYTINVTKGTISTDTTKPGGSTTTPGEENPSTPSVDQKESDSSLRSLTTNKGTLTPNFTSNQKYYEIGVGFWTWRISLKAQPTSTKAKLTYTFNGQTVDSLDRLKLNTGDNVVVITVTSEDGRHKSVYTVVINRAKSSQNYLKSLTTSAGDIGFDKNKLIYDVVVDNDVNSIDLTAIPKSKKATLTYTFNGVVVTSLNDLKLKEGLNVVKITVTAENGSTRVYTVNITRKNNSGVIEDDSLLKNLTISKGTLNFDPYIKDYLVGVTYDVDKVVLSATTNNENAVVTYTYGNTTIKGKDCELPLQVGDNKVVVTVTVGSKTSQYTVIVNRAKESGDSALKSLTTSVGILKPVFAEDTLSYDVFVGASTDKITLTAEPKDERAKLAFTLNGKTVDNLKDLELKPGKNKVTITVTAPDGTSRTYEVIIYRDDDESKSNISTLDSITIDGNLIPDFKSNETNYIVKTNESLISFEAQKTDPKSTAEYTYNGKPITEEELKNLNLKLGDNIITITVTAENGIDSTVYTVNIIKTEDVTEPIYKIDILDTLNPHYLEEAPFVIYYTVSDEEGNPVSDVDKIKVTFSDLFTVSIQKTDIPGQGRIILTPKNVDLSSIMGKELTLTAQYKDKTDATTLVFDCKDYVLYTYKSMYTISSTMKDWNLVLNTNFFTDIVTSKNITNGVHYESTNPNFYIEATTDSDLITLGKGDLSSINSLTVKVKPVQDDAGEAVVHIKGYYYGKFIEFDVLLKITKDYVVTIDAMDGYFDALTTKFEFIIPAGGSLDLAKYKPTKVDKENCIYYELDYYKDDSNNVYKDFTNPLVINDNLNLYAVYKETENREDVSGTSLRYYLKDIDLFYNDAYFKEYGEEKVIYPGAKGSYVVTLTNNIADEIKIKGITLEEETICIEDGDVNGCLNMGYVIRQTYPKQDYYYGTATQFAILNKDAEAGSYRNLDNSYHVKNIALSGDKIIDLKRGESIELSIVWEWAYETYITDASGKQVVDKQNDALDTAIGSFVAKSKTNKSINDKYRFLLSFEYDIIDNVCEK